MVKNLGVALLGIFPALCLQVSLAEAFCHRSAKSTINHSRLSSDSVDWTNTPHPAERTEGVGAGVGSGWHLPPGTGAKVTSSPRANPSEEEEEGCGVSPCCSPMPPPPCSSWPRCSVIQLLRDSPWSSARGHSGGQHRATSDFVPYLSSHEP